ncbi:hypothetical protein FKW77_000854 [Venturia effusa]|uniref:Uncharacterized protein n=1 Tax=Venturia effusa TaxID=50376 RepID=A0A517KYY3_9PEZI|nr:hypothetical protein FKW77_000854 [Venturia effusa]
MSKAPTFKTQTLNTSSPPTSPLAHETSALDIMSLTVYVDRELVRAEIFEIDDRYVAPAFNPTINNSTRDLILVEATALNEARLLCGEAMTLVTKKAARSNNHPEIASAHSHKSANHTKMKRSNCPYPENLKALLPVFIQNDAKDDYFYTDQAVKKLLYYRRNRELFALVIGPGPSY